MTLMSNTIYPESDKFVTARWDHLVMALKTPRHILADNLKRMIERAAAPGDRPSARAWAMSKRLDVRLIDRLVKADNAVTLDKLAEIAEACGLQPWQLLIEDFDPTDPPSMPITDEERLMLKKLRRLLGSE